MLQRCEDVTAGNWLLRGSDTGWQRLVTFGPSAFTAYARLRYLPDPARPGMQESEIVLPADHRPDIDIARTAIAELAELSSSAETCLVCIWEGYSGMLRDVEAVKGPLVVLPHRRYLLYSTTIDGLDDWDELFKTPFNPAPNFVWPTDHRWCVASDVDPHWAGIGADVDVIDQLVASSDLDVVRADPADDQPTYY